MFKHLEIQKKEDVVVVHVKLEKKIDKKTPIVLFSWKEAQAKIKEKHPEVKIGNPLDYKSVLANNKGENLEESWIFPIIMEQEKKQEKAQEPKKEAQEPKKEAQEPSPQRIFLSAKKNKNKNRFTASSKPATVEETEQSVSDQPAIVQEPTE